MPYAADLPALEPTTDDLIDLLTLPWDDTQEHLESLLVEAGLIELRRQVADAHAAAVLQIPTRTRDTPKEVAA